MLGRWILIALLAGAAGCTARAQKLVGDWRTPGGSVVRVAACGQEICLNLVKVEPGTTGTKDTRNPDAAMRGRPLCGLRIGEGFKAEGADAASGGRLYDPESGKTYSGKMTMDGEKLKLRGYIGVSAVRALGGLDAVWPGGWLQIGFGRSGHGCPPLRLSVPGCQFRVPGSA